VTWGEEGGDTGDGIEHHPRQGSRVDRMSKGKDRK
jgi:hypothetical protein